MGSRFTGKGDLSGLGSGGRFDSEGGGLELCALIDEVATEQGRRKGLFGGVGSTHRVLESEVEYSALDKGIGDFNSTTGRLWITVLTVTRFVTLDEGPDGKVASGAWGRTR